MSAAAKLTKQLAYIELTRNVGSTGKPEAEIQAKQDVDVATAVKAYLAGLTAPEIMEVIGGRCSDCGGAKPCYCADSRCD